MVKAISFNRDARETKNDDSRPAFGNVSKDSKDEKKVRPWPGTSQPGHIRPIGPAYPAGRRPGQDSSSEQEKEKA